jgi:hypothetical protein
MASIVLPDEGLPLLLAWWTTTDVTTAPWWVLILWTDEDLEPDQDTVFADLTEATFAGYEPVNLLPSQWTDPVVVGHKAITTYTGDAQLWAATGDYEIIYGYAITTIADPVILVIQKLSNAVDLEVQPVIGILPRLTMGTDPDPS